MGYVRMWLYKQVFGAGHELGNTHTSALSIKIPSINVTVCSLGEDHRCFGVTYSHQCLKWRRRFSPKRRLTST